MKWYKRVEYNTMFEIDEQEYHVTARKDGGDEFFAIEINGEYMADSDDLPTHEYLKQLVAEELEIQDKINAATFVRR